MQSPIRVTIVQTAHHFLYLPVHYALEANCFGYVPPEYALELWSAPARTDRQAYQLLKQRRGEGHNLIGFAVADPTEVLHDRDKSLSATAVLASLVTNSSFWAVDRRSHEVRFVSDLAAFNEIIAFAEGTTSHGIAQRICRSAKGAGPRITPVQSGDELTALTNSEVGTMALTPDLLLLDKLLTSKGNTYHVDLALGKTPEYNNVLVTALLSRDDVVTEHPELVRGLLLAIQRAMLLVRLADPEVVKFAAISFNESEESVRGALRRAEDAQVFPATIEVNQAQWDKAARAAVEAEGRHFDDKEHDRVKAAYESAVAPFLSFTRRSIREGLLPRLNLDANNGVNRDRVSQWHNEIVVSALVVGVLLGHVATILVVAGVTAIAVASYCTVRLTLNRRLLGIQTMLALAGAAALAYLALASSGATTVAMVAVAWFGFEISLIIAAAQESR